jgi:molybdopterin-guanine dinucleotide biosynthesis protein A
MISTAAILAGGRSKRMGGVQKCLQIFRGKTILQHMLEAMLPLFQKIVLVSNDPAGTFKDYKIDQIIQDEFQGKGPLAGIHAALKHSGEENVFVFACDYPLLNKELILFQMNEMDLTADATVPRHQFGFEPLHAIYNLNCLSYAEELLKTRTKIRILEMLNLVNTFYWDIEYNNAFTNINTPEDLKDNKKD